MSTSGAAVFTASRAWPPVVRQQFVWLWRGVIRSASTVVYTEFGYELQARYHHWGMTTGNVKYVAGIVAGILCCHIFDS